MLSRREFLRAAAIAAIAPTACTTSRSRTGAWVNDIHSKLNPTWVDSIERPGSVEELQRIVRSGTRRPLSIAGGRHAMGGQQFASDATLIDMTPLSAISWADRTTGIIDVGAGAQWPGLVGFLRDSAWGIRQKQTGADRLSIGGALGANAHGRGLTMKPFIGDIESFILIGPGGEAIECSRTQNGDLFALAVGGYGLFGPVASVRLRLSPRRKVERVVEERTIDTLINGFEQRMADGYLYGDFQFSIDHESPDFLRRGVFSCYRPVDEAIPMPSAQAELRPEEWIGLLQLAHTDKAEAYRRYVSYYLGTSGQVYWSDEHQLSFYPDDYHRALDAAVRSPVPATEMITEVYVPRTKLSDFMSAAAEMLRRSDVSVIYGTVRLIERDDESVLPWAAQSYACIVMNLHVAHSDPGMAHAVQAFRSLIDLAIERDGSYFLTYHRWARADQVERCYPRFREFLSEKKRFDRSQRFQSDWYRHYERLFS